MAPKSIVAAVGIVAGISCANGGAPPTPTTPAVTVGAEVPSSSSEGAIVGTIVSEPYSAVRKGAVVWLEDGPKEPVGPMSASLDNHDMTFVPFITVIPVGGTVTFGNTDPFAHNAFSPDGEGWDIGQIPTHGAIKKTFDKPNVYSVLCNLHKSMIAYIVVVPSSYFTPVGSDGRYYLNVPPGTYKMTAWAPRLKPVTKPVTVTNGEVTLNFELAR